MGPDDDPDARVLVIEIGNKGLEDLRRLDLTAA
jgi:hypothetical protein